MNLSALQESGVDALALAEARLARIAALCDEAYELYVDDNGYYRLIYGIREALQVAPADVAPPQGPRPGDLEVTVVRRGWGRWKIDVIHGFLNWGPDGGPYRAIGSEAHALAKAGRLKARFQRRFDRDACNEQNAVQV